MSLHFINQQVATNDIIINGYSHIFRKKNRIRTSDDYKRVKAYFPLFKETICQKPSNRNPLPFSKVVAEVSLIAGSNNGAATIMESSYAKCDAIPTIENLHLDFESLMKRSVHDLDTLLLLGKYDLVFLLEDLIPENAITILAGPSDTGKSTLALQIATSLIQGHNEVIGKKLNGKNRRVIYISTEDDPSRLGRKLTKQLGYPRPPNLTSGSFRMVQSIEDLDHELTKLPVDLVIIDTLADFYKGEINSSTGIRDFFNTEIKGRMKKFGFTSLILHHIGKNKHNKSHKDQLVGSQSIEAASRQVIYLVEGRKNQRELKIVKGNYVSAEVKSKGINLELNSEDLRFSVIESPQPFDPKPDFAKALEDAKLPLKRRRGPSNDKKARAASLYSEGYTLEQIAAQLKVKSPSTIRNWLVQEFGPDYKKYRE